MEKIYALKDPITFEIKYIGQTSLSLYRRLTRHVSESLTKKESTLKREWIKDLIKKELCPIIELLEITNSSNEREKYWINKYKDTILNVDESPNFSKANIKKVYAYIIETGNIIEFNNVKDASIRTNTSSSNILKTIHSKSIANNLLWSYNKDFKINEKYYPNWILLTDVKTKIKYLFKTQKNAILFIKGSFTSNKNGVKYALTHKDKEYKGYTWEYVKEHVKFGEFREHPNKDNPDPSTLNDNKVNVKEQRLMGEESTNKPNTSAEHLTIYYQMPDGSLVQEGLMMEIDNRMRMMI